MTMTYDVIVVGSGPAGSSAAWGLAQAGLSVAVVEKAGLPRYKTCGGGIIGRAFRYLPTDVRHVLEQDCLTAELHIPSLNLFFTTHRSTPIVSMTMRDQFDYALLSAAQAAGAVVHQHCAVEAVSVQKEVVEIATERGVMNARFVVAADGALSTVARKMGMGGGPQLIPAVECEVVLPPDQLNRFHGVARFDFGLLPHGYAWAFPKRQHLSIGVLSMVRREGELKRALTKYLEQLKCHDVVRLEHHGFVIPIQPRSGLFIEQRVLLVGDAAGFADPVTGEGISFALLSGQLAAQALIQGHLQQVPVQRAYRRAVGESILPELQAGRWLARLLYGHPRLREWAFLRQGQRLCEAVTDVMAGKRTYRHLVWNPGGLLRLVTGAGFKSSGYEPTQPPDGQA